jgi:hypothetical protein
VAGAVAVAGPAGEVGALHGGPGPGALHRGRVDHPHRVGPQVGVDGQDPDQAFDQRQRIAQALVVAGLAGQVRKRRGQRAGHEPQPAGLGADPEQDLGDREGEEFSVGELGRSARAGGLAQPVVDLDIECGQEGVEVGRHKLIFDTLLPRPGQTCR